MLKIISFIFSLLVSDLVVASTFKVDDEKVLKLIGRGELNYFIWPVYEADLYSENGDFSFDKSFALKLTYKMSIPADKIAKKSVEEMRRLGFVNEVKLAAWYNQMEEIFQGVEKGTQLTGFYKPQGQVVFYNGDNQVGTINDAEFGELFFRIWLDERTTEPKLRKKLLGLR